MRTNSLRRGLTAVATTLAVVAVWAAPSSAITAGIDPDQTSTLTVGAQTYSLTGDPGEGDCTEDLPAQTVDLAFSGNATSGTWTASGSVKARFRLDAPNDAQLWQADVSLTAASGTYTTAGAPSGYTHSLTSSAPNHIVVTAAIYQLTEPECVKATPICTVRSRVLLTAGSGVQDAPAPGVGDGAVLTFSSNPGGIKVTVIGGSCPATIASQLVGQDASGSIHLLF